MYNVHTDINKYIESKIHFYQIRIKFLKIINILLNLITILAGFTTTLLTSLVLSHLIFLSFPDWFFYTAAGISAATGLATSLLNFFVIKDNIRTYQSSIFRIEAEYLSYSKKTKDIYKNKYSNKNKYLLFLSIAAIDGSSPAKKEIKNVG